MFISYLYLKNVVSFWMENSLIFGSIPWCVPQPLREHTHTNTLRQPIHVDEHVYNIRIDLSWIITTQLLTCDTIWVPTEVVQLFRAISGNLAPEQWLGIGWGLVSLNQKTMGEVVRMTKWTNIIQLYQNHPKSTSSNIPNHPKLSVLFSATLLKTKSGLHWFRLPKTASINLKTRPLPRPVPWWRYQVRASSEAFSNFYNRLKNVLLLWLLCNCWWFLLNSPPFLDKFLVIYVKIPCQHLL